MVKLKKILGLRAVNIRIVRLVFNFFTLSRFQEDTTKSRTATHIKMLLHSLIFRDYHFSDCKPLKVVLNIVWNGLRKVHQVITSSVVSTWMRTGGTDLQLPAKTGIKCINPADMTGLVDFGRDLESNLLTPDYKSGGLATTLSRSLVNKSTRVSRRSFVSMKSKVLWHLIYLIYRLRYSSWNLYNQFPICCRT